MKKMRNMLVTLAVLMVLSAGSALAAPFWVGSVSDGSGTWVNNVMTFDWSSSGSAMAVGLADPASLIVGNTFEFYFQTSLVALSDPDGQPVSLAGLTTGFEYTLVGKMTEKIVSVVGTTAIFETTGGGSWHMLYDNVADSVTSTGFNFDDGIIVAKGDWLAGQTSTFTATTAGGDGVGSYLLNGLLGVGEIVDANYLDPTLMANGDQLIADIRFEGTLNRPALESTTTAFFDGTDAGVYDPAYAVTANDLLFKLDASSKFATAVPEPSTFILLGMGFLGLAGCARRKSRG